MHGKQLLVPPTGRNKQITNVVVVPGKHRVQAWCFRVPLMLGWGGGQFLLSPDAELFSNTHPAIGYHLEAPSPTLPQALWCGDFPQAPGQVGEVY